MASIDGKSKYCIVPSQGRKDKKKIILTMWAISTLHMAFWGFQVFFAYVKHIISIDFLYPIFSLLFFTSCSLEFAHFWLVLERAHKYVHCVVSVPLIASFLWWLWVAIEMMGLEANFPKCRRVKFHFVDGSVYISY